jgi:hypothetical protein
LHRHEFRELYLQDISVRNADPGLYFPSGLNRMRCCKPEIPDKIKIIYPLLPGVSGLFKPLENSRKQPGLHLVVGGKRDQASHLLPDGGGGAGGFSEFRGADFRCLRLPDPRRHRTNAMNPLPLIEDQITDPPG